MRSVTVYSMKKISLNGVEVYPFPSTQSLLQYIDDNKGILVAINAEKILHATDQSRNIVNRNIGYCDGIGAVKAAHIKGATQACKIPGCELWLKIIERHHKDKTFYLVGAKQEVIEATVARLHADFPGINIVGYRNGYFRLPEESEATIADIAALKPDVVFVAMGSPRQELFMEEMQRSHPDAIYQGLGGSFDVYTGNVKRAPKWWVDHNLEFAYRLIKEPKRIARQIHLLKFAWWLLVKKF